MQIFRSLSFLILLISAICVPNLATAEIVNTTKQTRKIDKLLSASLAEQKIQPNASISDELFVRRIYLAVVGRIPTGDEAREFIESNEKNKRDVLIDQLLETEGYVSHFYNYWADILRINSRLGRSGATNEYAYKHWIKKSLRDNRPYDKMVFELVSAEGNVWDNGATGYYQRDRGMPLDNMANTVRVFLGTRLECAQCHDHPFDEWKQTDFFHMASFSFGVRQNYVSESQSMIRREMSDERRAATKEIAEKVSGIKNFYPYRRDADIKKIFANDDRRSVSRRLGIETEEEFRAINKKVTAAINEYSRKNYAVNQLLSDIYNPVRYATVSVRDTDAKLPHDYQYSDAKPYQSMEPGVIFGKDIDTEKLEKEGYLKTYASWMTSKDNPRFTRIIANRLWKKAFGVGIVEPVDQFTSETIPSHPELLDFLEQSMKDLDYDMKSFLGMLYKSKAWQRHAFSGEVAAGKPFYFPGPVMQRMSAEQIWDSLMTLTIADVDHYQPNFTRELQVIDRDRKISEALESRTPEEFKEMLNELSAEVRTNYDKMQVIREKYLKARQDEDLELTRKLSGELREITGNMRRKISQVAYNGADARSTNMQALMANAGMAEMSAQGDQKGDGHYVKTRLTREKIEMPKGLSSKERANWMKQQRSYASTWGRMGRDMMRASELPTPAPRGHFLREFGQSDRELIENANNAASVPQALSLMNGSVSDRLKHPYSVLGRALSQCDSPQEEIETIYQLMLTRQPSEAETNRLLQEYEANPSEARNNIIWALLNTQQFIFIQ